MPGDRGGVGTPPQVRVLVTHAQSVARARGGGNRGVGLAPLAPSAVCQAIGEVEVKRRGRDQQQAPPASLPTQDRGEYEQPDADAKPQARDAEWMPAAV